MLSRSPPPPLGGCTWATTQLNHECVRNDARDDSNVVAYFRCHQLIAFISSDLSVAIIILPRSTTSQLLPRGRSGVDANGDEEEEEEEELADFSTRFRTPVEGFPVVASSQRLPVYCSKRFSVVTFKKRCQLTKWQLSKIESGAFETCFFFPKPVRVCAWMCVFEKKPQSQCDASTLSGDRCSGICISNKDFPPPAQKKIPWISTKSYF